MDLTRAHVSGGIRLSMLRASILALPDLERQILVLRIGGMMTEAEVGAEFGLSGMMVRFLMAASMKRIVRETAFAMGSVESSEVLETLLKDAICSGERVPPGLDQKVIKQIAFHEQNHPHSQRSSNQHPGGCSEQRSPSDKQIRNYLID